jgi:TonB-linked SusC/RagA family outer membrane protein
MKKVTLLMALILFCSWQFVLAQKTITGTVTDAKDGSTIPGVNVVVKGTTTGTATNIDGNFSIKATDQQTLVFSFLGYNNKEVAVGAQSTINVMLEPTIKQLDEVVVTGLGITKQERAIGFAATTVKSAKLVETQSTNFATALYGKSPGVRVAATPGGATSGVAIQIRGVNSISFKSTPLIVMDGVPVRDGEFSSGNYWGDQRIRSNGLVDFNVEDMESVTILKGASAAALYGSAATNGVILITTKSAKGKKGFSVDVNASYSMDKVAYLPKWQKEKGAGFDVPYGVYNTNAEGFTTQTMDGVQYRAMPQAGLNFGPKFDGKDVLCWDGVVRPYSYQEDGFANLFQNAMNTVFNVAVSNTTDKNSMRFAYTNSHTEGVSEGSSNNKNTFSLNDNYRFGKKVTMDVIVNFMNWKIHNRPYMIDRMINNFGGMFPSFDNGDWYKAKYKTSLGYKYVQGSNQSLTPDENIKYPNFRGEIADYMWNVFENNEEENINRLNAVLKANWEILTGLNLQLRTSTDYTSTIRQSKSSSSIPISYGYSGGYGLNSQVASIAYGDALLTYTKDFANNFGFTAMAGYNATTNNVFSEGVYTNGGLTTENKFDMSASNNTPGSGATQAYFVNDAILGTLNLHYKDWLYVEGTIRNDRTSTMKPENNSFYYPSVNTGFIFTEVLKLPSWFTYGKLRGSWGIVGNYPPQYIANPAYSQGNLGNQGYGSVLTTTIRNTPYGNDLIRPEEKHEIEFGLETRMFTGRLNFDISYYNAQVVDQILNLSLPTSAGASAILTNIGTMRNSGVEIGLNGYPVATGKFSWETGINYAYNKNEIEELTTGATELQHANYDGDAAKLVSTVGEPMGDWYSHPIATNSSGQKIIAADGTYTLDGNVWEKYGNSMPKATGGFFNTVKYAGFSLDMMIDFRFGGSVMPTGLYWLTCRGLTEESLQYPEGTSKTDVNFWVDDNWVGHETTEAEGPNGETVMTEGFILDGVTANGEPNTNVISKSLYYWYSYNWGGPQYGSSLYYKYIQKNSYIKMREISLAYTLPTSIASKIRATKVQLSVFGRNLFYFYRTIENMDSEQLSTGSRWGDGLNNAGTNPSSRTFGVMLRTSF